jgi:hypothetical protein
VIYLTDHADPDQGDLHCAPFNGGVSAVSEVSGNLFNANDPQREFSRFLKRCFPKL